MTAAILSGRDNAELASEPPLAVPSPYVEGTKIQFAWDSTSLTVAMACPQRYKYEHIDGWVSKSPDTAIALSFGILIHAGVEQYHRLVTGGASHDDAVQGALRHITVFRDPRAGDTDRPLVDTLPTDAEIGELRQEDADDDEADGFDLRNSKVRTRYHLFRALVWYFEHYKNDALHVVQLASGSAAVEFSFRVPIGQTLSDGTPLLLSGHYDKLVEFNGELFVSDIKTTKSITRSWKKSFDLSHQMTGYTVGGKIGLHKPIRGVFIDGICLQIGGVKFSRFSTHRSPSQLDEYLRLLKYTADQAEMWFLNDYYPQNTSACFLCPFKEICAQPPEFRAAHLRTYWKQRPAWNPLQSR